MQTRKAILFIVAAVVLQTLPATAREGGLDAYKIPFTLQEIRDPQLNNELAVTIAVPNGWRLQDPNIVQWTPMAYFDPARISYTLTGPRDEVTFMFLSTQSYRYDFGIPRLVSFMRQQQAAQEQQILGMMRQQGMNIPMPQQQRFEYVEGSIDGGAIVMKPASPEAYVQALLSQDRTISRVNITKISKPEQIVKFLQAGMAELNRQLAGTTPGIQFKGATADTALVEFTCFKDGKQYEQQIALVMVYFRSGSPVNATTGASDDSIMWIVSPLFSAFALKGKLEEHELEIATIMENSLVNPVWKAKVSYLASETTRIISERQLKTTIEISKALNETSNYVSRTRQEVFQNRQDSMSKVSQGWTDVFTGTDRVQGDDGKIYAVPVGTFPDRKVPWAW